LECSRVSESEKTFGIFCWTFGGSKFFVVYLNKTKKNIIFGEIFVLILFKDNIENNHFFFRNENKLGFFNFFVLDFFENF
jgi:hypothetical protein